MRVGFFGIRYPKGIGILLEDFARHVEKYGHTACFLTYPISRRKPALITGQWARSNVTIVNTFKRNSVQVDDDTVRGWIQGNKLDVVFTIEQPNNWNVFKIAKELGVPTINYVDIEMFHSESERYKDCTAFFVPTQQGYDILKSYGLSNVVHVQYYANGCEYPWNLRKTDKVEFVIHAGWGGMNGRKGVGPTIRAFIKADCDTTLTVITQKRWKTYEEEVRNLVRANPNIHIREVNDTQNVYNKEAYTIGHVAIQPSLWEGLGLTYIEALMSGMPVITCNAPPMNEYVTHEETGLLVECKEVPGDTIKKGLKVPAFLVNEDKLAESIKHIADHPELVEQMSRETVKVWTKYGVYYREFNKVFEAADRPLPHIEKGLPCKNA